MSLDAFRALGIPAEYMPHAYRPSLHKPGPVIPGLACDLSFVGTGYWSRADFFEAMDLDGLDVLLAGNWQVLKSRPGSPLHRYLSHDVDQCLTNEETVRVYQSSRAGINFYRREGSADGEASDGRTRRRSGPSAGRHGWRPAHIHFLVGAPGYREVITALYMAGDERISSDTVFGATEALITDPKPGDPGSPFGALPSIHFDFSMAAAQDALSGRVGADPSQILSRPAEARS